MQAYNRIPIWENLKRTQCLVELLKLLGQYYANSKYDVYEFKRIENEVSNKIRSQINYSLIQNHKIVESAGISTCVQHTPPPAIGGYIQNIDILYNYHNLDHYQISCRAVADILETAIGVYEADKKASLIRTLNPFYWIGHIVRVIVSIPFTVIDRAGFDAEKASNSLFGKFYKVIAETIIFIAGLLTILHLMGWLESVKGAIQLISNG